MQGPSSPDAIHPSILKIVESVRSGVMNGKLTDQKSIAAATMYCQIRAIEYSKIFAKIGAGFLGVFVVVAVAWTQLGAPVASLVFLTLAAIWSVKSYRLYKSYDSCLTWPELNSLKRALYLTPEQYAYLDCLQFISESMAIGGSEKALWASKLNAVIDRILSAERDVEDAKQAIFRTREALLRQTSADSEMESIQVELTKVAQ